MKLAFTLFAWFAMNVFHKSTRYEWSSDLASGPIATMNLAIGYDAQSWPGCFIAEPGYDIRREIYCWPWPKFKEAMNDAMYYTGLEAQEKRGRVCIQNDPCAEIQIQSVPCDWKKGQRPGKWIEKNAGKCGIPGSVTFKSSTGRWE